LPALKGTVSRIIGEKNQFPKLGVLAFGTSGTASVVFTARESRFWEQPVEGDRKQ
jgi:hypothetical protein